MMRSTWHLPDATEDIHYFKWMFPYYVVCLASGSMVLVSSSGELAEHSLARTVWIRLVMACVIASRSARCVFQRTKRRRERGQFGKFIARDKIHASGAPKAIDFIGPARAWKWFYRDLLRGNID